MGNLSEAARRRIAAVILLAGIVVAALAITNVGPFSNPPSQAQRAQDAVEGFFASAQQRDFKTACDQLTKQEQQTVEQRAGSIAAREGLKGCDEILKAFLGDALAGTKITKVSDVRVSGNQAVVDATVSTPGTKGGQSTTFHLFLIRDVWKIADFGV
jgi:S1-C subfamily serine protease